MPTEPDLYYLCVPTGGRPPGLPVEVVAADEFLADEPACRAVWGMVDAQYRTRGKFLAIWPGVRHLAVYRDDGGAVAGFLFISTHVNWQLDYVTVRPDARGQGVATALVLAALEHAHRHAVPYVMLTSRASLRPLYEGCGFEVVGDRAPAPVG